MSDWRNINEIIRVSIKSLTDTVKNQGMAIRDLDKKIRTKPSREEIDNILNFKANNDDIFQALNNLSQELLDRPKNEEIYKILDEKINKNELIYYLNQKPNIEDINSLLNDKVSMREYKNNYNDLLKRFEMFKNEILNKINNMDNNYAKRNDLINIQNELENKANIIDVENALEAKEDKEKIYLLLQNKIDKNEIENIFDNKLDKNDFIEINKKIDEKLDKSNFEQFLEEYHNNNDINNNLGENLNNKVNIKEFKLLNDSYIENKQKMSKKIDDIDNDLDRLIESVKEQFQSLNVVINNLEHNKVDNTEFDVEKLRNFEQMLQNKVGQEDVEILINKTKNNLLDAINNFKNGENANMKIFEENIQNKIDKIIYDNQSMLNDLTNTNQNINNFFTQKQAEMESLMTRMRLLINNNELYTNNNFNNNNNNNNSNNIQEERIKNEIKNIIENNNNKINQKFREKLDVSKFEEFLNGLKEDLDNKINLFTMKKANEEIINEVNNKIRELYTDINTEMENKISKNEIETILSNKLNNNNLLNNNLANNNMLNEKLSVNDFKDYIDSISLELKQKLDINKFNSIISTFNSNFENIHKDMNSKADIKNIVELLKNKLDNENFNKIIKNLQKEISTKVNTNDFSSAMDNQAIINDTLCNENNIGRWLWKSGKVKNNLSVPWEVQIINTSPDNFLWEKDKPILNIKEGGLYEINMGFYADKKPMVQIMINGEVVISAINSNSFVIHQSPGGRMKGTGKTSFGNVTGLTMVDFIILPDKAKLSISYTGEEGIGFLGLKKL